MSERNDRSAAETPAPSPTVPPRPAKGGDRPEVQRKTRPASQAAGGDEDPRPELKRRLEETRLPADLKAQILASLPPPEERERLFQELRDNGGLSSEQFFASLGLDAG